jgi:hypothetical protein
MAHAVVATNLAVVITAGTLWLMRVSVAFPAEMSCARGSNSANRRTSNNRHGNRIKRVVRIEYRGRPRYKAALACWRPNSALSAHLHAHDRHGTRQQQRDPAAQVGSGAYARAQSLVRGFERKQVRAGALTRGICTEFRRYFAHFRRRRSPLPTGRGDDRRRQQPSSRVQQEPRPAAAWVHQESWSGRRDSNPRPIAWETPR